MRRGASARAEGRTDRERLLVYGDPHRGAGQPGGRERTVFTAEDLERRQVPFVADLVASTPGAMMIRSGAPGTLTSLFVRGGESDYNKVLLDGMPLNEPGGSFYLNNLTTENLDRIEIVRGAYSSLFGSDAMASVIQLFTRRADGTVRQPRGSVQIDGGTYGTIHANASVAGATSRVDYSGGVARSNSDNRVREQRPREHDPERESRGPRRIDGHAAVGQPRRARKRRHARHDRVRQAGSRRLLRQKRRGVQRGDRPGARGPVEAARVLFDGGLRIRRRPTSCSILHTPRRSKGRRQSVRRRTSPVTRMPTSAGTMRAIRPIFALRHRLRTAIIG